MSSLHYILQHKIIAILRGISQEDVLPIASALYEGGIKLLEVTLNSPGAFSLIEKLSHTFEDKMLIGAGTVLTVTDARSSIDTGARFLISPTLDIDVIKTAKDHNVISIPGAYTPTEIYTAYKSGADIVKVFPAQNPEYIKHILAPLNHIALMPTGGVNINNISAFQKAGGAAFGIGSSLVNSKERVDGEFLQSLVSKAKNFVEAIT